MMLQRQLPPSTRLRNIRSALQIILTNYRNIMEDIRYSCNLKQETGVENGIPEAPLMKRGLDIFSQLLRHYSIFTVQRGRKSRLGCLLFIPFSPTNPFSMPISNPNSTLSFNYPAQHSLTLICVNLLALLDTFRRHSKTFLYFSVYLFVIKRSTIL